MNQILVDLIGLEFGLAKFLIFCSIFFIYLFIFIVYVTCFVLFSIILLHLLQNEVFKLV